MSEFILDRYEAFKERFGAAGIILGVIAIVLAIGGSAIAATGLNGKQKKEVKAIAKSFPGKPGAPGAPGAAGTNGTNGTNGKDGAPGAEGKQGPEGPPGKDGKDGEDGQTGFTATLPPGSTETGAWFMSGIGPVSGTSIYYAQIPLNIPLAQDIDEDHTEYVTFDQATFDGTRVATYDAGHTAITPTDTTNCPTDYFSLNLPAAKPGYMCIYEDYIQNATALKGSFIINPSFFSGTGAAGTAVGFDVEAGKKNAWAQGSWAVTACDPDAVAPDPNVCPA